MAKLLFRKYFKVLLVDTGIERYNFQVCAAGMRAYAGYLRKELRMDTIT